MPASTAVSADLHEHVATYIAAGYPALAGLSQTAFEDLAGAAINAAETQGPDLTVPGMGALLVVTASLIAPELRVPLLRLPGSDKPGIVDRNHDSDARKGLGHYVPRPELGVPDAPMYVTYGVERGDEFRNVRPTDALDVIASRGRSPLTIDEGISLASVAPQLLIKNHCFMLGGSTRGDNRMPALWISEGAPKLGWCFDRNAHTWLGVASALRRSNAAALHA
jgi:hypothetical protein